MQPITISNTGNVVNKTPAQIQANEKLPNTSQPSTAPTTEKITITQNTDGSGYSVKGAGIVDDGGTVLEGEIKSNYNRFVSKIPANSKSNSSFQLLDDGNYLFQATSSGKVPGSSALYQKWVNPQGETFKMLKTTFAPDGSMIHVKSK